MYSGGSNTQIRNLKMFGIGMVFGILSSEFEPPLYCDKEGVKKVGRYSEA